MSFLRAPSSSKWGHEPIEFVSCAILVAMKRIWVSLVLLTACGDAVFAGALDAGAPTQDAGAQDASPDVNATDAATPDGGIQSAAWCTTQTEAPPSLLCADFDEISDVTYAVDGKWSSATPAVPGEILLDASAPSPPGYAFFHLDAQTVSLGQRTLTFEATPDGGDAFGGIQIDADVTVELGDGGNQGGTAFMKIRGFTSPDDSSDESTELALVGGTLTQLNSVDNTNEGTVPLPTDASEQHHYTFSVVFSRGGGADAAPNGVTVSVLVDGTVISSDPISPPPLPAPITHFAVIIGAFTASPPAAPIGVSFDNVVIRAVPFSN
jgi:hypothetical protein